MPANDWFSTKDRLLRFLLLTGGFVITKLFAFVRMTEFFESNSRVKSLYHVNYKSFYERYYKRNIGHH